MCYSIMTLKEDTDNDLVFYGLCSCGCGELVFQKKLFSSCLKLKGEKRFKVGHNTKGRKVSLEYKLILKSRVGEKAPCWKGGRIVTGQGYILIYKPDHPYKNKKGYVKEHRLVMEEKIGRFLLSSEIVHHINGVKSDNRLENLELLEDIRKHTSLHLYKNGPNPKLDEKSVKKIKQLLNEGEKQQNIAKMFGVNSACIFHIKKGTNWKWVE